MFKSGPLFWPVAIHEARLLWRSGTAVAFLLLVALWVGLAVKTGVTHQERQAAIGHRLQAKDKALLKELGDEFVKDPQGYRNRPYVATLLLKQHAILPPGPLAALDAGQSDLRPAVYPLHTDWYKVFAAQGPLRNEASLRAGHFDSGFLVTYLLPLAVIVLCFGLLAADRERGTMLLLLSQPVASGTLLAAGLLVRFILLEIAFIGSAALFTYTALGAGASWDTLPRFAVWAGIVTVYAAFWFALSALVVSTGGKAVSNALVLVMGWVLLTIVVPGLIALGAQARHPVPPRSDIMKVVNVTRDEAFENWRDNEKSFRLFYKDFPELVPVGARITPQKIHDPLTSDSDFQSRVMIVIPYAIEQAALKAARPHREALQSRQRFVMLSRLLSPAVAVREGLMDTTGSGDARYGEFDRQVNAFWSGWRYHWLKRIFRGPQLTLQDYRGIPEFRFEEEDVFTITLRLLPGLAATFLLTLLLAAAAATLVRRNQSPLVRT